MLAKNPKMEKGTAFAVATQQSHALGKSPKGYGTAKGKKKAKAKFDTPKGDVKSANPGKLDSPKLAAFNDELNKIAKDGDGVDIFSAIRSATKYEKAPKGKAARLGELLSGSRATKLRVASRAPELLKGHRSAPSDRYLERAGSKLKHLAGVEAGKVRKARGLAGAAALGVGGAGALAAKALSKPEEKTAATAADDPYLHDQIGRAKTRARKATAPDPKFQVKSAMIPLGTPKVNPSSPQAKLLKAQRVGTPEDPKGTQFKPLHMLKPPKVEGVARAQPPKMPGMPKVGFDTSQFSGILSEGRFFHPPMMPPLRLPAVSRRDPHIKESGSKALKKEAFTRYEPGTMAGHVAGSTVGGLGGIMAGAAGAKALGLPPALGGAVGGYIGMGLGRKAGIGIQKALQKKPVAPTTQLQRPQLQSPQMAARMQPGQQPPTPQPPQQWGMKQAAAALTPQGRLASSRSEGKPKSTGFSGPSIADVSKPIGYGRKLPGATKNRI